MTRQIECVEIKITLADEIDAACDRLGLDAGNAEPYRLWFCEVARLDRGTTQPFLAQSALILRLRSRARCDDSTVKLRREGRVDLPARWDKRSSATAAKYEGDWTGTRHHESASLTLEMPAGRVPDAVERWPPLAGRVLSGAQTRFAAAITGRSRHLLRAAQPLGPVRALKWEGVPRLSVSKANDGTSRKGAKRAKEVFAERWQIDDLDFLELSIQVNVRSATRWQERFAAAVADAGLDRVTSATKTQLILDHLLGRDP